MAGENGGKRPGAGRKPGKANARTIARMQAKRAFIDRVITNTDKLFNAQLDKAVGEKYLMVKITEYAEKKDGSRGAVRREYHEIVSDPLLILEYLDSQLEGHESINDEYHYYYMTTKPADTFAISNMLDRAYGKPTERVILDGESDNEYSDLSDEELQEKLDERIDAYLATKRRRAD